jgi:Fic family protein
MSTQIETERSRYYAQLESAQRGSLDITAWLAWFLACLERAIDTAERSLASVLHKGEVWRRLQPHALGERQRRIVNRVLDGFDGALTTSKYAKLAKCSADTALRDVQDLLARGILVQNPGGGRSTSYRLAAPDEIPKAP